MGIEARELVQLFPTHTYIPLFPHGRDSHLSLHRCDTFPHRSRTFPRLSNPFHGAEFSRLRHSYSSCRITRISIFDGEIPARLRRRKSKNARTSRSEANFDKPKAQAMGARRITPEHLSQGFGVPRKAQLQSAVCSPH